ncbi:unnamed protein product [Ectocarpus sp. CCAP 1310/34]|nr:unnamed protein product [Ectocarpus sp. CCAP 1310/34]
MACRREANVFVLLLIDIDLQYPQRQASAFIPSPPARQRFHSTAPTTTARSVIINSRCSRSRCPAAAAASPAPREGASTAQEDGASARHHEATTPAAVTVAEATSGKAHVPEAAAALEAGPPPPPPPPSYRRLYDAAMELLESEIGLEPYPIPQGLGGNCAVVGKGRNLQTVETSITAFRSSKFRQVRAALVETDQATQVLNLVMFPSPSYDLPIFGADLVTLPGVHLICIDLQPAHPAQQLDAKAYEAMREAHKRHVKALPWGGDLPEAAQKFFSPHCLWAKLDPEEAVEQKALDAMMDYLREYLRLVEDAEPVEGDGPLAEISSGHAEYSKYRRENDPARGMLTRFYGAEWTEAAIAGILFDFEKQVSTRVRKS